MAKVQKENALFIQRVFAYLFDFLIIFLLATLISIPFYDNDNIEKLNNANNELVEKTVSKDIDTGTYLSESIDINYEIYRKTGFVSLITIFLEVLYFICYQFYKKGQTLGKKIMRIRVISNDDKDLTMNQMIYRASIINSIFISTLVVLLVICATKEVCFYGIMVLNSIQYIIIVISAIMIMFSKKSRGLHDAIANTKVIRDNSVKEMEVCES